MDICFFLLKNLLGCFLLLFPSFIFLSLRGEWKGEGELEASMKDGLGCKSGR